MAKQAKSVANRISNKISSPMIVDQYEYQTHSPIGYVELDIRQKLLNKIKDLIKLTAIIIEQEDIGINFPKVRINLKNLLIYEKISKEKEKDIIVNEINNGIESIKDKITSRVKIHIDLCINSKKNYKLVAENLIKIQIIIDEITSVYKEIKTKML